MPTAAFRVGIRKKKAATGPILLFSDDFNRANASTLGSNWNAYGSASMSISGNKAVGAGGNLRSRSLNSPASVDQEILATVTIPTSDIVQYFLRAGGTATPFAYFWVRFNSGVLSIATVSNTDSVLTNASFGSYTGTHLVKATTKESGSNTIITVYVDSVAVASTTVATPTGVGNYVGIYSDASSGAFDDVFIY